MNIKVSCEIDDPSANSKERTEIVNVIVSHSQPPFKVNKAEAVQEEVKEFKQEAQQRRPTI